MQRDCYRKVRDTTCPCLRGSQQSLPLIFTHPLGALTLWWSCHALLLSRVTQSPTPRHGPLITDICWVPTMPGTVPSTCTQDLFSFHLDISATYTDEHTKASTSEFTLSQYLTLRSPDSKTKVLFQDPKILGLGFLVFFFFFNQEKTGEEFVELQLVSCPVVSKSESCPLNLLPSSSSPPSLQQDNHPPLFHVQPGSVSSTGWWLKAGTLA